MRPGPAKERPAQGDTQRARNQPHWTHGEFSRAYRATALFPRGVRRLLHRVYAISQVLLVVKLNAHILWNW